MKNLEKTIKKINIINLPIIKPLSRTDCFQRAKWYLVTEVTAGSLPFSNWNS